MITIAYLLKMKGMTENLIRGQILPLINRENAVRYAQYSLIHLKHGQIKQDMFQKYVIDDN